ncbi:MAG: HAD hydrolase-like protein [Alicyclobacillus sp.]|nr:HAD hydrolase-like protein [Alicyclobacillus sp.]
MFDHLDKLLAESLGLTRGLPTAAGEEGTGATGGAQPTGGTDAPKTPAGAAEARLAAEAVRGAEAARAPGSAGAVRVVPSAEVVRAVGTDAARAAEVCESGGQSCAGRANIASFEYKRALWTVGQETFQEWYLGDRHVGHTHQPGKRGFLSDEVPIVPPAEFTRLLTSLRDAGVRLGIATGRPDIETTVPLEEQGWLQFFERRHITTASDVLRAEQAHPEAAPLAKPHPYSYLRSYLGSPDPDVVLRHPLPLPEAEARRTLIVGDSVADLLAARAIGCDFAAVLTGLEGQGARAQFEAMGCAQILNDVLDLWQKVHAI